MDWATSNCATLLGESAESVKDRAALAFMVGLWPEGTARRERLGDGRAAWLRVTDAARLHCVALAPWDDVWTVDHVAAGEFFATPFPKGWTTKNRANLQRSPSDKGAAWAAFEVGGWACGIMDDRSAVLVQVGEIDGAAQLRAVVTVADGPRVPIEVHKARRWFGLTKWPEGLATLWAQGRVHLPNYRFLTMVAGKAQASHGKASKPAE